MADTLTAPANLIAGEWRPSAGGDTYENRNPARPDEVVGEFPSSTSADVEAPCRPPTTHGASGRRRHRPPRGRPDHGGGADREARRGDRPGHDARDGQAAARGTHGGRAGGPILRYSAGEASGRSASCFQQAITGGPVYTVHRPVGVVGLITPWNFPAAIPAWKLAPALIYGNTIVLKLAQDSPLTGLHIARALDDAGLPAGVLNVVIGRGGEVGTPLVEHPGVRAISFTGSVPVGEGIRETAGRLGKRASSSSAATTR